MGQAAKGQAAIGWARLGGDGSGKNRSVGDRSVRNGSVTKKVAADFPPFNWFIFHFCVCLHFVNINNDLFTF